MSKRPKIDDVTPEEDRAINAGIASDPDTYELDIEEFAQLRRPGRPIGSAKASTTLRLDIEVLDAFRLTGKGWQTRMNSALREWLKAHNQL